jgi:hypothetical protein
MSRVASSNISREGPRRLLPAGGPALLVIPLTLLASCALPTRPAGDLPATLAESEASYSYIPLDPLPVAIGGAACRKFKPVLDSLPDEAVRIAVGSYDATGSLSFGPGKVGAEGHTYQVVLDYVSVDEGSMTVKVERKYTNSGEPVSIYNTSVPVMETRYTVERSDTYFYSQSAISPKSPISGSSENPPATAETARSLNQEKVSVPVYIGVGLRLTATVRVIKGSANLSSLGALAAGVEAGTLNGSLVVQTLGINGKSVSTALPLPSELNQTTIQSAILALGSIKAILYDDKTLITPRVVGIYNPVGGGQQFVNGIISTMATNPVKWSPACDTSEEVQKEDAKKPSATIARPGQ